MKSIPDELYQTAIPLHDAITQFASPADAKQYRELVASAHNDTLSMAYSKTEAIAAGEPYKVCEAQKRINHKNELYKQLSTQLWQRIIGGELVSYGYNAPRKLGDLAQMIPNDLLHQTFTNWRKGSIKWKGVHIESIRVMPTNDIETCNEVPAQNGDAPTNTRGRPGINGHILDAFYELLNKGKLDFSIPLSKNIRNIIIPHLKSKRELTGMSFKEDTIRHYVAEIFKEQRDIHFRKNT